MKNFSDQPKSLLLAVAIAVGLATVSAGCSKGYNGNDATPAATDAGTDGMSAGVADSSQPVTDTWITTKVKTALTTLEGVDSSGVSVETNNGVVTLTGSARSQSSVNAMKDAAMRVKGVSSVNTSALRVGTMDNGGTMDGAGMTANDGDMDAVTQDSQQPVQDTWITTKVKTKLHTVDGLDNSDIAVETSNGIVTLSGTTDTQSEYDAAVAAAKSIKGVKDVHASLLTVQADK